MATYAWPFLVAYIFFTFSSLHFLIISESAVFTIAVSTVALPLAGIWWSLFRVVGVVTPLASGKGSLNEKCRESRASNIRLGMLFHSFLSTFICFMMTGNVILQFWWTGFFSLTFRGLCIVIYSYIKTNCCRLASGIRIPLASSQHNLYDIYLLLCIQY